MRWDRIDHADMQILRMANTNTGRNSKFLLNYHDNTIIWETLENIGSEPGDVEDNVSNDMLFSH